MRRAAAAPRPARGADGGGPAAKPHGRGLRRGALALLVTPLLVGCSGQDVASGAADPADRSAGAEAPVAAASGATIARDELDAVLDAGIGRFLQRVDTEPELDGGRFVGFRLVALRTSLFDGVDLQVGDTVLRVNGLPLERPEDAVAIWETLRSAGELTVDLLRDGQERRLRVPVVP